METLLNQPASGPQPPNVSVLFAPAAVLGPLNPVTFGHSRKELREHADSIKTSLQLFLSIEMNSPPLAVASTGEVRLDGNDESWMAALEAVRATVKILSGTTARAFIRDALRLLPEDGLEIAHLLQASFELAVQVQVWLAFMLNQDDEAGLQADLIPRDDAEYPSSPGVLVDLT